MNDSGLEIFPNLHHEPEGNVIDAAMSGKLATDYRLGRDDPTEGGRPEVELQKREKLARMSPARLKVELAPDPGGIIFDTRGDPVARATPQLQAALP